MAYPAIKRLLLHTFCAVNLKDLIQCNEISDQNTRKYTKKLLTSGIRTALRLERKKKNSLKT